MSEIHQTTPRERVRPKRPLQAWFDVRRDRVGSWAFALNRLTALGLTLYLVLHLAVLYLLTQGESQWDMFVEIVKSPLFLALDVVLIFGILFHGLNGLRVALVGLGVGARRHRTMFWILSIVGLVLLVISAWLVFTI
ncbi:MAG: hypothetical protein ACOC9E_02570 [Chloroflexota bacterium]